VEQTELGDELGQARRRSRVAAEAEPIARISRGQVGRAPRSDT
jgi:hypothetical protein